MDIEQSLQQCRKGNHTYKEILRSGTQSECSVARWCTVCGCVVVDTDYDGRTKPGDIMGIKAPLLTSYAEDPIEGMKAQQNALKQMRINFHYLLNHVDSIHAALCPDETGTWQQRAQQAAKAAAQYGTKKAP